MPPAGAGVAAAVCRGAVPQRAAACRRAPRRSVRRRRPAGKRPRRSDQHPQRVVRQRGRLRQRGSKALRPSARAPNQESQGERQGNRDEAREDWQEIPTTRGRIVRLCGRPGRQRLLLPRQRLGRSDGGRRYRCSGSLPQSMMITTIRPPSRTSRMSPTLRPWRRSRARPKSRCRTEPTFTSAARIGTRAPIRATLSSTCRAAHLRRSDGSVTAYWSAWRV